MENMISSVTFPPIHLSIIICTKDRPKEIQKLLSTIQGQTKVPNDLIVVDGSDHPIKSILDEFQTLPIRYVQVRPPSLTKQRNVGISMLQERADWIGFLDDDLVLHPKNFMEIEEFIQNYQGETPLAGVGLNIKNDLPINRSKLRDLFLLNAPTGGIFTRSGCPTALINVQKTQQVDWLSGGNSFWQKKILNEFKFDEWFSGTAYYEDVDFSYRVSRKYSLYYLVKSGCIHLSHPISRKKAPGYGTWQITAWWYFTRKAKSFSPLLVLWSMLGLFINNFIAGTIKPSSYRLLRSMGNLRGFVYIITGRALIKRAFQK